MIRQPAVAGLFYPSDPMQLARQLNSLLDPITADAKIPKAIIAPHAGYAYSGPIAASVYARLRPARTLIKHVVLIGPSHRVSFSGLAISEAEAFLTPLGPIAVDQATIKRLRQFPFVGHLESAHRQEHSLEVQLPFLQTVLDDFTLVPIVAGDATPEQVARALDSVWSREETLIVVSSDLSHYHNYATAQKLDQITTQLIETLQYEQLNAHAACGKVPICGLLKLAKDQSFSVKMIDLRNSGDTAGDKTRVVGYGAYVVN